MIVRRRQARAGRMAATDCLRIHADGTYTRNHRTANTDVARGVAIKAGIEAMAANDRCLIGPGTFEAEAGIVTPSVAGCTLSGCGQSRTTIYSNGGSAEVFSGGFETDGVVRDIKFHAGGAANEPALTKGGTANVTWDDVTMQQDRAGFASHWVNATANTATLNRCTLTAYFDARGTCVLNDCKVSEPGTTNKPAINCNSNPGNSFTATRCTLTVAAGTGPVYKADNFSMDFTGVLTDCTCVASPDASADGVRVNNTLGTNTVTVDGGSVAGAGSADLSQGGAATLNVTNAPTYATSEGTITSV